MKTIKKEIEVPACEICDKEISPATTPYIVEKTTGINTENKEQYLFHQECVDKLLIKTAKN